jgi:hypothetical protein
MSLKVGLGTLEKVKLVAEIVNDYGIGYHVGRFGLLVYELDSTINGDVAETSANSGYGLRAIYRQFFWSKFYGFATLVPV